MIIIRFTNFKGQGSPFGSPVLTQTQFCRRKVKCPGCQESVADGEDVSGGLGGEAAGGEAAGGEGAGGGHQKIPGSTHSGRVKLAGGRRQED